eukprot:TRINITY_DN8_c0_g1_i1.p1 TRINITY_DN8_c0_g1~~TRINITY_DN8_c0_g1_i1.p1  ORF type:complete len:186 (-),score=54.65 TRINITY_DN8_c0_g1_i1:138-653(-)
MRLTVLVLVVFFALAANAAHLAFPGVFYDQFGFSSLNTNNAGGEGTLPFGDPGAKEFPNQPEQLGYPYLTTGWTDGLGGKWPGQVTNRGVDPVRNTVNNRGWGHSSSSTTSGSSGGAASGSGFALYETKFPQRTKLKKSEFIATDLTSTSDSNGLFPTLLALVLVIGMVLF